MTSAVKNYANTINPKAPKKQTQPINGRETEMVVNNAGGYVFRTGPWIALNRFLIMGTEKKSYYATAQKLTKDAATNVLEAIKEDGIRVVNEIVAVSDAGRAAKNDPAIFALGLALVFGDDATRKAVEQNILKVCRIPTHLFAFVEVIKQLGKWNSSAKRTVANWYNGKKGLEYQILKYQSRNGWGHRDVLRLAHVKPTSPEQDALFHWVATKGEVTKELEVPLYLVAAYEHLRDNPTEQNALDAIAKHNFSHEMIPRDLLKSPVVWEALLYGMGFTALVRNLGRLSALGLAQPLSQTAKFIVEKLGDKEGLQKARIHPINVLAAMKQYQQGRGDKGSLTWTVNQQIVQALEGAFYDSFKYLEPTGKNFLIAIDCSGSMFGAQVVGLNNICAAEAAAVMAMSIAKVEKNYHFVGFSSQCEPLAINPSQTLDQVMNTIRKFSWNTTDCAQPALYAIKHKLDVDMFTCWTDNETYHGRIHPTQALAEYRRVMNKPNAKQAVFGTSVTSFTIADPKDPLQMDFAGFDAAIPSLVTQFATDQI